MGAIVLLGPQRLQRTLAEAMEAVGVDRTAPVAAITAGWREREEETDPLQRYLERPVVNLRLYARSEQVVEENLELSIAHRERLAMILQHQELYRVRLAHAMEAARELCGRTGDPELLDPARESAVEAVRALDEWHLGRLAEIRRVFREQWRVEERDGIRAIRAHVAREIGDCGSITIAGGDVAALRNRMLLFDVASLFGDRPVFAWSAGSMVVSERVVLFHDAPPQGAGDPEVLAEGLGLAKGVIPFPHASRRLRLDDPVRVGLMARRFAPHTCIAMDEGSRWLLRGSRDPELRAVRLLEADGTVRALEDA